MRRAASIWVVGVLFCAACDSGQGNQPSPSGEADTAASAAASPTPSSEASAGAQATGALSVEAAQAAANERPDELRDKPLKVSGVVAKIGTQTAGPAGKQSVTHYIKLTPSKDETKPSLYCDTHHEEPKGLEAGTSVTVEGRVELTKVKSTDGSPAHRLDLRDCKVL